MARKKHKKQENQVEGTDKQEQAADPTDTSDPIDQFLDGSDDKSDFDLKSLTVLAGRSTAPPLSDETLPDSLSCNDSSPDIIDIAALKASGTPPVDPSGGLH